MGPVLHGLIKLQRVENRLRAVKSKLSRCRRSVLFQENQLRTLQNELEASFIYEDTPDQYLALKCRPSAGPEFDGEFLAFAEGEGQIGRDERTDSVDGGIVQLDFLFLGVLQHHPGWAVGDFAPLSPVIDIITG